MPAAHSALSRALTIFVGFLHDFAAGCWAATVLAVYWLERTVNAPPGQPLLVPLQQQFFYIGLACLALVLLAGVGRTFTYAWVGAVYGAESERLRRRMLIAKHLILFSVFGGGTAWQYALVFAGE